MTATSASGAGKGPRHHVILGSGAAGNQAAELLRQRDPDSRISMITMSRLPFINRYDLPEVFRGRDNWRDLLAQPVAYYRDRAITLRRESQVTNVDARKQTVILAHREAVRYDTLLVATGGRGYLPEELAEFRHLMHGFASYEQAMRIRRELPAGGTVVMLGGDMIGLHLARTLLKSDYRVALVAGEHTFWPHRVSVEAWPGYLAALERMGVELLHETELGGIAAIEEGAAGMPARRVVFRDGTNLYGDVVLPFYGIVPALEFMVGAGVDIERGLLVGTSLRTTDPNIYAAGDVCQIWSGEENRYRFYNGWKNVYAMGEVAARNMTGADDTFSSAIDEELRLDGDGFIDSPFWVYQ